MQEKDIEKNEILKPTNDYVFKRIFGQKQNEDITRNFLEAITGEKYENLNLEQTPILESDLIENKMGILDVRILADKENDIDIEMQVSKNAYVADRILWYWAKMYASSLEKGEAYKNTKRAICILIADFKIDKLKDIPKYSTRWNIREEEYTSIILTNKLDIRIIELEKLEKAMNTNKELLAWCKFIKFPEKVGNSEMEENEYIKKAREELEKISRDKKERRLAELRDKAIRDEIAIRDSGYMDGFNEGIQKGTQEGIQKGIEKGIEEGKNSTKLEIAKSLLNKEIDIQIICDTTGLTKEEVENLRE